MVVELAKWIGGQIIQPCALISSATNGIAIIRRRLEAAELFLGIIDEDRKQNLALVGGDQRPVVGDELGAQRSDEQNEKIQNDQ